jgi:hypothetical protein
MKITPYQALELLQEGIELEYLDEDIWFKLFEDSPIRLLWEHEIRIKKIMIKRN